MKKVPHNDSRQLKWPQPEKFGWQLPAGSGEPLPWHHDGGEAYQELVVRLELELKSKVLVIGKTQSAAWQWTCFPL